MAKILIVDDEVDLEPLILQKFRRQIYDGKFSFVFAHNGREALDIVEKNLDIDLVISDINMPEMDGLTLLEQLNQVGPLIKAVVVSAYGDMDNIRTAMNRGAFDFITKPVNFEDLELTINRTLSHLSMLRTALEARTKLIAVNQELAVTAKLQQTILPKKFPETLMLQLHAEMKPATDVGGDFYDFFWLNLEEIGVVMADVSGKGVTAGMFMAVARTHLKAIAPYCKGPAECLKKLNNELSQDNETSMFVTVFYGIINVKTGLFKFANGGHCPPIHIDKRGDIKTISSVKGVGIGVFEEAPFEEHELILSPQDLVFLYTDGITEAMSPNMEEYGSQRLLDICQLASAKSAKDFLETVIDDVKFFAKEAPQSDDITCLAFRFLGG